VVPRAGSTPTLADLTAYLTELGTARQYLPERVELMAALPRTLTGKVQKFKLRTLLAREAATEGC
jgi:cyclohexanecarboxylate-CoA ligase